ncbi:hypothetical protein BDV96DRAFT_583318 [Lophiotrema nucula]|uniref:Thioredoxin domain-containing protein n=1 Tax=Lophiotrema nucula TaxID=690887 RepID=A0A6A5YVM9_9PLEO|nr:hypothetical protein BDV96DRAFT_583318 [Lophiotrema nucula]
MPTEEAPPVLTLKERIAALKLAQAADNQVANPKPPAPAPKAPSPPPPLPTRHSSGNGNGYHTAPPVCRDPYECSPESNTLFSRPASSRSQSRKEGPPLLPPRRPSQPVSAKAPPALPPRRPSELTVGRKRSTDSVSSVASGRSAISSISARTSFSAASESNGPKFRIRAPEYDPANLPALPERRSQKQEDEHESRLTLKPTKSAPAVVTGFGQKDVLPPPSLPGRRQASLFREGYDEPPPKPVRSALSFGLNNALSPPPVPSARPQRPVQPPAAAAPAFRTPSPVQHQGVVELDARSFDNIVLHSGKPAFVDFYAPFCKYCKELDPIYEELAAKYQHQNITIAKIDSYGQKAIGERYEVEGWPTLKFFDGTGGPPVNYEWSRDMEWMSRFIDEQLEKLPAAAPGIPPPIPLGSKPNLAELNKTKPRF